MAEFPGFDQGLHKRPRYGYSDVWQQYVTARVQAAAVSLPPPRQSTSSTLVDTSPVARPQAGAPPTVDRADTLSASRAPSPPQRPLDLNSSTAAPAPMAPQQPVVLVPQAPFVLPFELAAPPTNLVRPNSCSSSEATTSPLPRTPGGAGAVSESEGGPAARTRARTSPAKSPAKSPAANSPAKSPDGQ